MITKERWAVPVTAVPFTAVPVTATPKKLQDSAQTSPAMAFTRRREQTFAHTKTTAAILILLFLLPAPALCQNCTNHCEVTGGAKLSGLSGILILQANVDEKTDEGTDLYILNCSNTGPFTGPDEEEFLHYFSVDNSQSSELRVSVSTSLNGVPDFPNNTEQILGMVKFSLLDNVTNCQVQLEHNIVDENTQNPEINQTNYEVQIREDFPADLSLYYLTVLVSDNDATSPNNEFSLEVQDCPLETSEAEYGGPGTINEVQFQLTSKLDYEKQKSYTCTITAKDKGSPVLSSQPSSITITVQDMPDEPPIFTYNYYYIEITSTLPSDEPLEIQPGAVYATDGDTEIKSPITYSMIDADPEGVGMNYFKIDSSTGNVTLTRELDEEILINLSIDFFITARDETLEVSTSVLRVMLPPLPTTTYSTTEVTCPECTCPTITTEGTCTPCPTDPCVYPTTVPTEATTCEPCPTTETTTSQPCPTTEIITCEPCPTTETTTSQPCITTEITTCQPCPTTEVTTCAPCPTTEPAVTSECPTCTTLSTWLTTVYTCPPCSTTAGSATTSPCPVCSTTETIPCPTDAATTCPVCPTDEITTTVYPTEATTACPVCPTDAATTTACPSVPTTTSTTGTTTGGLVKPSLTFKKQSYAGEIYAEFQDVFQVSVEVQGADINDVTFSFAKPDGNFGIDPKSGEITVLNGDVASGSYTLTAVAVVENTSLRDEAKVYIKVLHPSTTTVTMINSLLKETLQEDSQESLIREIKTEGDTGPVCIISVEPDAAVGKFDVVQQEGGSWVLRKIEALDYETTQEIKLKLQVYETGATCLGITSTSDDLLRSQALVIITVTDINDQQPEFQVPHAPNTIIAYPQDKALQNVVGPVITLQASDNDTVGDLSYGLSNSSSGAPFTVESNTGAVFVENEFVCSKECSLEVKVSDGATEDSHASIKVVPLDMDHISTIVLQNTDVSQVDDYLQTLSDKSGVQVSNLYVSPIIEDSSVQNSPSTLLLYSRIRQGRGWSVTSNSLQVHVYSIDSDGNLMSVEDLNKALSDGKTNVVAQEFTDKALFQCVDDTNETSNTGLKVAVGILGALLGLILLAALAFLVYKKRRDGRAKPIASTPINTLGRAYPNLSYSEEHEGKRESLRSRDHKTNGTLNSLSNGRSTSSRDSPPLFLSTLSSQKSESPKSEHQYRGLRRVDAGSPEYYGISSPAPPPSFTKITSFSSTDPNDYNTTTTTPLYTVASTSNASMPDSTSIYPALDTIPESPTHIYAEINKPAKNEPADISPPPAKSILKHKSESSLDTSVIPAVSGTDEAKPQEPDADYDETEEPSSSSFLALKGSPPPRKHSTASANGDDDDSVSDHDGITYPGGKKSNLKQHDGDAGSDYEKKSVAFKVLVDTKEIEAENLSPASKIAAVKSDALLLMEANKKKLEEENDDNDDIDGNDADNDASEEDEKL
nr:mucin-22-like isoform X1 [Cherax quadricarinatus]